MTNSEGLYQALTLLKQISTPQGIIASLSNTSNYKRIWTRDAVICGLAGIIANEPNIIESFYYTLKNLAKAQHPYGNIPSNIQINKKGHIIKKSYGQIAGRVDVNFWFIIGFYYLNKKIKDPKIIKQFKKNLKKIITLSYYWEFNNKGLVYVPQGGDWADEYYFHGYILSTQLLRVWALKCYAKLYNDKNILKYALNIQKNIQLQFWPDKKNINNSSILHPIAYSNFIKKNKISYFLPCLSSKGYFNKWDTLANSLAIILNITKPYQVNSIFQYSKKIIKENNTYLLPSFWPAIFPQNTEWSEIKNNYRYFFSNNPGKYHNGGIWPMINAWWILSLIKEKKINQAQKTCSALKEVVKKNYNDSKNWGFYEYVDSRSLSPHGVQHCSWSAASLILSIKLLEKKSISFLKI